MIKRHKKRSIIATFAQYGVHIWAILIIANAALAYAFNLSTQAAKPTTPVTDKTTIEKDITPSPKDNKKAKGPKAVGPLLTLVFTIPGIGSDSATMTPKRLERNVTVFLYAPDANSLNKSVKPLYSAQTTAKYDTNKLSPTYTSYIVKDFDLGSDIKDGKYQIAFRTDESLRTLIKENPNNVGGAVLEVKSEGKLIRVKPQKVLMGDTLPKEGDNTVDVSDYNAFINCFGEKSSSEFCKENNYGDFDDNGTIDGVDYNLLLRAFGELIEQGQAIPQVTAMPTISTAVKEPTPTKSTKKVVTPTKSTEKQTKSSGGGALGGILFFFFLLLAGGGGFVLYKKNEQFRALVQKVLRRTPSGETTTESTQAATPEIAKTETPTETSAAPSDIAASTEIPVTPPTEQEHPADPSAIAASTEIPVTPAPEPTPAPTEPQPPINDVAAPPPAAGETVEKDCYVKKKLPDEAKTGFWLTLTDDNGALEAHFTTPDIQDGFAKVKGVMKTENGKTFLEVSELVAEG